MTNNINSFLFLAVTMAIAPVLFAPDSANAQNDLLTLSVSPIEATPESALTFTVQNLDEAYSISNYGGTSGVRYAGKIYARALDVNDAGIVEITTCSGNQIENFDYLTLGPVRYLNNNDNEFEIWGRELCEKIYGENSLCNGRIEFWAKEIKCANAPGATPGRSGYVCCCNPADPDCGHTGRESNHIRITINNGNVCSDECDYAGQTRCYSDNFAQTCGNYDSDSCLEWSATQSCGANHICVGGVCVEQGQDECDYIGQTKCYDSTSRQVCGNYDSDSWLEWSSPQNCGYNQVCENGTCVEECTSHYTKKCYANDLYWYDSCNNKQEKYEGCGSDYWTNNYQCSGNWTQREKINQGCSNNACSSCSVWENYENCSNTGKSCVGGVCVEQGQDECSYINQHECSGASGRTCGNYDSDSYLEWSSWNNCDTQCYHCGDGTCDAQCGETSYNCANDCGTLPVPIVDIKANNSDGTITIPYNTSAILTWTSSNANSCYASNNWSGSKSLSGSESTGALTYSKIYTITCAGNNAFASDSITVNVTQAPTPTNHAPTVNAGPNKETYGTESVVLQGYAHDPDGDPITYSWSCGGGSLSNPNIAQPIFYAPYISSGSVTYTCTLRVYDNKGLSSVDSMNVWVREHQSPTLHVSANINPNAGIAPLNNVDLTATVSGTATGNVTYFFDCTNDGTWEKITSNSSNSYTAYNLCNYASEGTYTAKVRVERANLSIESTKLIKVSAPEPLPNVNIKANNSDGPITIPYNTSATLKWTSSDVSYCFASGDWDGSKALASNSWSTGDLTSSKTYTIGCRNKKGVSIVDTVVVNVASEQQENSVLVIEKIARNVSDNTSYGNSISADPGEIIAFTITVKAIDGDIDNIIVKDTLPHNISYTGNLKVSGKDSTGNIFTGLDIGHISEGKKRTITFTAKVAEANNFNFGETSLINACIAYNTEVSVLDTAKVVVNRKSVLGAATSIKTGAINPIQFALLASLLVSTLLIISLFILHKFLYPRSFAWQKMVDKYQNLRFYAPFLP